MLRRTSEPFRRQAGAWRRWRRDLLLALLAAGIGLLIGRCLGARSPEPVSRTRPLMGTLVEIRLPGPLDMAGEAALERAFAEMARLERIYNPRQVEEGPADTAESLEVAQLVELGRRIGQASGGALDLRLRDLIDLWGWESEPRRPTERELDSLLATRTVRDAGGDLADYAFGALAKGLAVDRALAVLREGGVTRALVNAGGEVGVLGRGWTVGVQHPRDEGALLASFTLDEGRAVATSGDYENCFFEDGRRWHHLLDPATGRPADGCRSVSVLAPTCAEADAWATALFVAGPSAAMALAAARPELEVLVVDADGKALSSSGWPGTVAGRIQ
ncbi:MAG: FAD:protein FMN transferase [bacterium]|nr:FAD:protein FMN transferase [bacterium]